MTGALSAPGPEILMRSRYVAYVKADIDYIAKTMTGDASKNFSYEDSLNWSTQAQWRRLDVLTVNMQTSDQGTVEFKAFYKMSGIEKCLHECSLFECISGIWYYVGSKKCRIVDNQEKKIKVCGRNEPCSCGSGKKYKKCCYFKNQSS